MGESRQSLVRAADSSNVNSSKTVMINNANSEHIVHEPEISPPKEKETQVKQNKSTKKVKKDRKDQNLTLDKIIKNLVIKDKKRRTIEIQKIINQLNTVTSN